MANLVNQFSSDPQMRAREAARAGNPLGQQPFRPSPLNPQETQNNLQFSELEALMRAVQSSGGRVGPQTQQFLNRPGAPRMRRNTTSPGLSDEFRAFVSLLQALQRTL